MNTAAAAPGGLPRLPGFAAALRFWFWLGWVSFGGPAGQIALMHREIVERRRWLTEGHFLDALNFCMLLPGPEAQQLATYLGWRLHGARGGLAAGVLFVLPGAAILFALSWVFMAGGHHWWLAGLLYGLNAVVIALVAQAVLRIGRKALRTASLWALAAASFILIHFFHVSFVILVLGAAGVGWVGNWRAPSQFPTTRGHQPSGTRGEETAALPPVPRDSWRRRATVVTVCLVLWWAPVFAVAWALGWQSTAARQALFFSKASLVTFGGAYAVLPYVAQQAVERYGWLTPGQMMTGLGLAETTPGPLIMVLQFVGFVGGWQNPGPLSPLAAGALGAAITTWVTFVPCFLFVFLGAPHIERLRQKPRLAAALTAITAAVVGVILNLFVAFTVHALWAGTPPRFDAFTAALAVACFVALHRFNAAVLPVLAVSALLGLAWKSFGG